MRAFLPVSPKMTAAQRSAISVGVKTTLLGALLLGLAALTRDNVIFRPEFNTHVQTEVRLLEAVLTLQCRETPDDSICRPYRR